MAEIDTIPISDAAAEVFLLMTPALYSKKPVFSTKRKEKLKEVNMTQNEAKELLKTINDFLIIYPA